MAEELKAFQREDRYIVIKRKDLAALADKGELRPASLDGLMDLCADLPTREYVVIESDWPEYQAAWQMIEERINGSAQLPGQGGEAVEVVAYRGKDPDGGEGFVGARWPNAFGQDCIVEPLMTVAQHSRIVAALTPPSPDAELVKLMRDASVAMSSAHESLFKQCLSNGITNAWGNPVDVSKINDLQIAAKRIDAKLASL